MSESAGRVVAEVVDALGTGLLIPQWIGDLEPVFPVGTRLVPEQLLVDLENENIASEAIIWRKFEELDAKLQKVRALAEKWETTRRQFSVQGHAKKEARDKCASELLALLTQTPTEAVKK